MGWLSVVLGAFVLALVLVSLASGFAAFLFVTHQTCADSPIEPDTANDTSFQLFGTTSTSNSSASSNSTTASAPPLAPLPVVADDLALTPLADLSLTQSHGNKSAITDLTNQTYWQEVRSSEFQTYEQLVPQTVLEFFNSSQEWRDWALQYIPDVPSWLATGAVPYSEQQVQTLESSSGGTGNSTTIAMGIQNFAASAAGLSLASLDFLSFDSLTGLKVLFQTDNATLAACQTLPGQLGQLYESAFDPTVPQDLRAQYLGRALAITSVMLIMGGRDGFAEQFGTAIDGLGLGDSWSTVKPYLGDITTKVSGGASSATFAILQTLAQRFPQNSVFVTGFTADRVDSMVDVLEKRGISNDAIQNDIGQIAQAAGTSSDDEAAGEAADFDSIQQGDWLQVYVRSGNKMVLYQDATGDTATIRGTFLQQIIPGFDPRGPNFVQIHYQEAGVTIYSYYPAKVAPGASYSPSDTNWLPVASSSIASNGDVITVSVGLLTPQQFIQSIPAISYDDIAGASWVTDFSEIKGFELDGDQITMSVEQEPLEGVSSFVATGQAMPLTNVGGDTFMKFTLADVVNSPETLKIVYDGYGEPLLSIQSGTNFDPVTLVSSDGVKLKFVYDSGGDSVATATDYLQPPSVLWTLGTINEQDFGFDVPGATQTFVISQVMPVRYLEWEMVNSGGTYDLGTVGAEIGYTVAEQDFGIQGIQLNEPSMGGADLLSGDGTVTIQARMLGGQSALSPTNLEATLSVEMNKLTGQVQYDFSENPKATIGYAILSYLDPTTKTIITLVAVIPKP